MLALELSMQTAPYWTGQVSYALQDVSRSAVEEVRQQLSLCGVSQNRRALQSNAPT